MSEIHSKDFDNAAGVGDLDGHHDLVEPRSFDAPAGSTAHVVIVKDRDGELALKWKPSLEAAKAHRNRIVSRCERFNMEVKIYRLEEVP